MASSPRKPRDGQYEVAFCVKDKKTKLCKQHSHCDSSSTHDHEPYTVMKSSRPVSTASSAAYSVVVSADSASEQLSRSVSNEEAFPYIFEESTQLNERRLYAVVNPRQRDRNQPIRAPYSFANDGFRRSPSTQISLPPSIPESSPYESEPYVFAGNEGIVPNTKKIKKNSRPAIFLGISILALLCGIAAIAIAVLVLIQIQSIKDTNSQNTPVKGVDPEETPVTSTINTPTNSREVSLFASGRCALGNDCHPTAGICINTGSTYGCVCKNGWTGDGKECTEISYRTCAELREVVGFNTGYYKISPDPTGKIPGLVVKCVMERDRGITEIEHDSEEETLVHGCDTPGCYSRNITYRATMEQIVAVIEASAHCSQHIKYRCYHSSLADGENSNAWWVSRQQTKQTYWAEGAGENSCACSLQANTTCPGCYCNINDSKYRKDEGDITNKTLLPIMQLRYGDIGESWEDGFHTLGRLRCYG